MPPQCTTSPYYCFMSFYLDLLSTQLGLASWVTTLLVIVLLTVSLNYAVRVFLRQADKAAKRSSTTWDDALINSAARPVLLAMWFVSGGFMARVLQRQTHEPFLEQVLAVRDVALVACSAWFLLRFIGKVGSNIRAQQQARGDEIDHTTVDALMKLTRLLTVIVTVLVSAQTLGFQIGGLLALGGVGGLAVGLAAKDLLANFFGGLTIYLDRPFGVGEWIRSPDKSIEGTVEHISWRHTRIRAFNKNPIYVPNAVFTSIVVENPSRMSHRRLKETIGLRYDDFNVIKPVVEAIHQMLQNHPGIDTTQTMIVNFNQFGASTLDIMIYTFTKTIDWVTFHAVKQDVLLQIGVIIEHHGAQIAFPTQTVQLQPNSPQT